MYNIENKSNLYFLWDGSTMKEIGDEDALILFLARGYRNYLTWNFENPCDDTPHMCYSNIYFDNYACVPNDAKYGKCYQFFDGMNRVINPLDYQQAAWDKYQYLCEHPDKYYKLFWRKTDIKCNPIFRYDPIPHTRKHRGGPPQRPRKVARLHRMYANPEYKGFNRGSEHDVPGGWWDDFPWRNPQKCWKEQRKTKHQWKER